MKHSGFSIIELVVAVSLIAVVSLIATPPLLRWKKNAEMRGETFRIATALHLARNYAIKYGDLVVIEIEANGYHVFVDNGEGGALAGDWVRSGQERLLVSYDCRPGMVLSSNFPANRFRFKKMGRNQPGSIMVSGNNGKTKTRIVVNVLGRIRTEVE
jgi:prepilin-type N-terminal cleavage/methylation domain-containing protein